MHSHDRQAREARASQRGLPPFKARACTDFMWQFGGRKCHGIDYVAVSVAKLSHNVPVSAPARSAIASR